MLDTESLRVALRGNELNSLHYALSALNACLPTHTKKGADCVYNINLPFSRKFHANMLTVPPCQLGLIDSSNMFCKEVISCLMGNGVALM